jgi:hypothetical protein
VYRLNATAFQQIRQCPPPPPQQTDNAISFHTSIAVDRRDGASRGKKYGIVLLLYTRFAEENI